MFNYVGPCFALIVGHRKITRPISFKFSTQIDSVLENAITFLSISMLIDCKPDFTFLVRSSFNLFVLATYFRAVRLRKSWQVGRDRGAGDREKRGLEVYGRREKMGREAGFPRWREAGEEGKNYATLRNISQSK